MKYNSIKLQISYVVLFFCSSIFLNAQTTGLKSITINDLQSHLNFLASNELQGRATGTEGLKIAANYIASQAQKIGLKTARENQDYFQSFFIEENSIDQEKSKITIEMQGTEPVIMNEDFYPIIPQDFEDLNISGEVVFAGYGINSPQFRYNDFNEINIENKIILIMNRAPLDETGTKPKFDDLNWNDLQNFSFKYFYINSLKPKAVLLVFDPKSGYNCLADLNAAFPKYLSSAKKLKGIPDPDAGLFDDVTRVFIIHRNVADKLLEGTGMDLKTLQEIIDDSLESHSFPIPGKTINIELKSNTIQFSAPNVLGIIEGSDPILKKEYIIYTAHFDHIGTDDSGNVYSGADDNASGTTALLEMAEAFMLEKDKIKRSIGFLWVSAEEIGLFGSKYYTENPVVPLNEIVAVINLDMVGRTRTPADTGIVMGDEISVLGGDTIGVIGGLQSKILMDINKQTLIQMKMVGDYTYNDPDHPEMYFYRSDQINFVRHDIPALFYSTGTHRDYHQVTDTPGRIDYDKLKKVSAFTYMVGYNIANFKGQIVVDNPFSKWGKDE